MIAAVIALLLNGLAVATERPMPAHTVADATLEEMKSVVGFRARPGDHLAPRDAGSKPAGGEFNLEAWNREYVEVQDRGRKIWVPRAEQLGMYGAKLADAR